MVKEIAMGCTTVCNVTTTTSGSRDVLNNKTSIAESWSFVSTDKNYVVYLPETSRDF
jgi:hypothetical protein